jgi:hypothetical protein
MSPLLIRSKRPNTANQETSMSSTPLNAVTAPSDRPPSGGWRHVMALAFVASAAILSACGGGNSTAQPTGLACDDGIKTAFKPDANTTVLLVKAFKQGDPVSLSGTPATPTPQNAPADLCLVKLLVGPGNAGAPSAPSTSAGIGIEVWLPTAARWNQRIRAYGSGGWAGSAQADITRIGGGGDGNDLHVTAAGQPPTMGMRPYPGSRALSARPLP